MANDIAIAGGIDNAANIIIKAPSILDPQAGSNGAISKNWNIRVNREVEPDI